MKFPALHFYVGDWMKAPEVRVLSYAARGLWIDMLCLMFESPRRGFLQHASGRPVSPEQLARMTGGSHEEVRSLLQELNEAGVYSKDEGTIFSRRMVRDEESRVEKSTKCADAGKKGGGRPRKGRAKGHLYGDGKGQVDATFIPTHKGAPEDEDEDERLLPKVEGLPEPLRTLEFRKAWKDWLAHRKEIGHALKPTAQRGLLADLETRGPARAVAAIRHSIAKGWQGCFEPDEKPGNGRGGNLYQGLQDFVNQPQPEAGGTEDVPF